MKSAYMISNHLILLFNAQGIYVLLFHEKPFINQKFEIYKSDYKSE
jgi:hypothetical protein